MVVLSRLYGKGKMNMSVTFDKMHQIYACLQDKISKEIFMSRINYLATSDNSFRRNLPLKMRNLSADIIMFAEKLYNEKQKKLVVFGAGANGTDLAASLNDVPFFCFIDNYKNGMLEQRTKLPVYSLDTYKEKYGVNNSKFVIAVSKIDYVKEIYKQLISVGVTEEDIIYIKDWRNNASQYFDVFIPHDHETFVDCGCYDGSTAFRFAGWCAEGGKSYDKIWSFEPDAASYVKCQNILKPLSNCELFPYGISDKAGMVSFLANGYENAKIIKDGNVSDNHIQQVHVVKLDEILDNERITFIKMDIEGAEYDALKGAEKIIREQKPRLAISVYHHPNHIVEIPELLLKFRSDYRFYLRHYSLLSNEVVLYAE